MISELEYNGEIKGKKCAICKLVLEEDDEILFCPECETLFHEEHLIDWLIDHNDCPVCGRDFTQEIEKYSIREGVEKIDRDTSRIRITRKKLILYNPETEESYRITKGVTIFFGLIFALAPTVVIALIIPFPIVLAVVIASYIFYFAGMVIINHARTKYRFYWDKITFSKKGIIIGTSGSLSREVKPEKIKNIKLRITESSDDNNQNKEYHLALEINTTKELLQFGDISSSKNYIDIHILSERIDYQVKKHYNIEPIYTRFNANEYLLRNRKFILISGIFFVILNAILIPIGYFFVTI